MYLIVFLFCYTRNNILYCDWVFPYKSQLIHNSSNILYSTMRIINQIETTQYPSPNLFCESKLNDPNRIKILGVGSSMREKSYSTQALKVVLDAAKKYNVQTQCLICIIVYCLCIILSRLNLMMVMIKYKSNKSAQLGRCVRTWHAWLPWFYLWCIEKFFRLLLQQFAWKTFGYLCTSHEKGLTVMDQMCKRCVNVLWLEYALWYIYKLRTRFWYK